MNTGIIVAIHGVLILLFLAMIVYIIILSNKIVDLEMTVEENLGDISKLKKVTVGNYLDVIRIKKKLGLPTDSETTGEVAKSEES